eukprot:9901236-Alexandrium_andersonii.AAC.1
MSASLVGSEMCIRDSLARTLPVILCGANAHVGWSRNGEFRKEVVSDESDECIGTCGPDHENYQGTAMNNFLGARCFSA